MKTERMESFASVERNLASIGFVANQRPLHTEQLINVVRGTVASILQYLYLVFEANTDKEYMHSIFMTTFGIMIYTAHVSSIIKTVSLFDLFQYMEQLVNERKLCFQFSNNKSL